MVTITVHLYDHNLQEVVVRSFWGKSKDKAEKRWQDYMSNHRHQEVRQVSYS